jgi:hypothetical protein
MKIKLQENNPVRHCFHSEGRGRPVTAKKWKQDLAFFMADISAMDKEARVWYNVQHNIIMRERREASAASSTPPAAGSKPSPASATMEEAPSTAADHTPAI